MDCQMIFFLERWYKREEREEKETRRAIFIYVIISYTTVDTEDGHRNYIGCSIETLVSSGQ